MRAINREINETLCVAEKLIDFLKHVELNDEERLKFIHLGMEAYFDQLHIEELNKRNKIINEIIRLYNKVAFLKETLNILKPKTNNIESKF